MKIDLDKFLALTAMLAAPLVTASGCVITGSDDDNDTGSGGTGNSADDGTDPSGNPTGNSTSVGDDAPATDDTGADTGGTGADTGGTGADTGGSTGVADSTGGNELGNCCEVHEAATCDVTEVSDCVCAEDPFCCETTWDLNCIMEVNDLSCGVCELPPSVWDCTCTTDCDGAPVDTVWQVCASDDVDAATMGTAACEADLDAQCKVFSCEACECFTSEVPEIDCP